MGVKAEHLNYKSSRVPEELSLSALESHQCLTPVPDCGWEEVRACDETWGVELLVDTLENLQSQNCSKLLGLSHSFLLKTTCFVKMMQESQHRKIYIYTCFPYGCQTSN